MKKIKKAALHNLGCKVNAYETDAMQQLLEENGYEIVPFGPGADVYIINTCTVTNIADRKSRQMLHKAKKMNPDAIVAAVGCYAQTAEQRGELDECVDIIVGNNRKKDIVALLEEYQKGKNQTGYIDINQKGLEYEALHINKTGKHTRAYVKVQDGCNQFCSYCIIPYARGRVRSRKIDDVVEEMKQLAQNGYREIVITGIHVSSYGTDFEKKENLLTLLKKVHDIQPVSRIRLSSLEPRIITPEFVRELCTLEKVCPHFHLSLQSGCDETLRRMNRRYTTKEYAKACELLRSYYTHPAVTTDVITGFPGETKEEFLKTVRFVGDMQFYETHIFKYSKRQGTKAAVMPNQVTEEVKSHRSSVLLELNKRNSRKFREYYIGKQVEALMEEAVTIEGEVYQTGHTREYVKVAQKESKNLSNTVITRKISKFLTDDLLLFGN